MPQQFPCLICKKNVGNSKSVECQVCEQWVHTTCENLNEEIYKLLLAQRKSKGGGIRWMCTSCSCANERLNNKILALEDKMNEMSNQMNENTAKVSKASSDIRDIQEDLKITKDAQLSMPEQAQEMVLEELANRERKKSNLVIYNVAESESEDPQERMRTDMRAIQDIMNTIRAEVNVSKEHNTDTKFCVRIGERSSNPRPLLVGFVSEEIKIKVLNNAKFLKNSKYDDISLAPDLTSKQRQEDTRMRGEVQRKNDERSEEDFLAFEWRLIGQRGQRRIQKVTYRTSDQDRTRTRLTSNRPRSQRQSNPGGNPPLTGTNQVPLGGRTRRGTLRERDSGDEEEVQEDQPAQKKGPRTQETQ